MKRVLISGTTAKTTEKMVRDGLEKWGTITKIEMLEGMAYVDFESHQAAESACSGYRDDDVGFLYQPTLRLVPEPVYANEGIKVVARSTYDYNGLQVAPGQVFELLGLRGDAKILQHRLAIPLSKDVELEVCKECGGKQFVSAYRHSHRLDKSDRRVEV